MQRRKLPQPVKAKPKLVIQRTSCLSTNEDPSKLVRSISISKMGTINKQNEHLEAKSYHRRSLISIHKEGSHQKNQAKSRSSTPVINKNDSSLKENSYISDGLQPNLDYKRKIEDLHNQNVAQHGKKMKKGKVVGFEVELQQLLKKTLWLESEGKSKFQVYHSANCKVRELFQRTQHQKSEEHHKCLHLDKRNCRLSIHKCFDETVHYKNQAPTNNNSQFHQKPNTKHLRIHSNVVCQRLWEEQIKEETSFVLAHLAECDDYIMSQPNKILHEACRRHKYLEEELFAYADLLSISHVGAQTYTPQNNIQQVEDELDRSMRMLNRELIQGHVPNQEKGRMMRDYVLEVRQAYSSILQELMSVIDVKTEQTKMFVSKVLKWEENYITRKQFLGNLKKEYYEAMFNITQAIASLGDIQLTKDSKIILQENVGQLNTIYMLGNSFY